MKEYIESSISFDEYIGLIDSLLAEGKTTGPKQSESMFNYGRLNRARMERLEKTIEIDDSRQSRNAEHYADWIWLVITEGWCGDAAQNIPLIEKIAAANPGIETRYILRDEYPELMDQFLTDGSRSIPKLIAIDRRSSDILGAWGPRPKLAQDLFYEQKSSGVEQHTIHENLQRWYLTDRGRSLQNEIAELAEVWSGSPLAKAA
jgi:hypothetical protein